MSLTIFEVQSSVAADGVYSCFRQKLLAAGFDAGHIDKFAESEETPTPVNVFNVVENDTLASYEPALAYLDRIAAWEVKDDEGTTRWIGMPLTPSVRRARTTEAAGASTSIICNLFGNDGETELTGGALGAGIEVFCRITESANLEDALPRLADDIDIFVQNLAGQWWCKQLFQASENCLCSSP